MKSLKNAALGVAMCAALIGSAWAQSASSTTLAINSNQGTMVANARDFVLAYCVANRLTIVSWKVSMNLTVTVGNSTATFTDNGTQKIQVQPVNQDYSIGGRSIVAFRLRNARGGEQSVRIEYSYVGSGTLPLQDTDANSTVQVFVQTLNAQVTSMDMASGHGEVELNLALQRL
jgi:hypothetical protein